MRIKVHIFEENMSVVLHVYVQSCISISFVTKFREKSVQEKVMIPYRIGCVYWFGNIVIELSAKSDIGAPLLTNPTCRNLFDISTTDGELW